MGRSAVIAVTAAVVAAGAGAAVAAQAADAPTSNAGTVGAVKRAAPGTVTVGTVKELTAAIANRDVRHIVLKDGTYRLSGSVVVNGRAGLRISAQHVGKARFTGTGRFDLRKSPGAVVEGLDFAQLGSLSTDTASTKVRLLRNTFHFAPYRGTDPGTISDTKRYVAIGGDGTVIDHNTFRDKPTEGVLLQIGYSSGTPKGVRVSRNHFLNQSWNGKAGGGEAIRLGLGDTAAGKVDAVVEHNLFERTNGDPEALSVKSSGVTVRYNTFRDSTGGLVLRAGNGSSVYGNFVLSAPLRIHGAGHKVFGNYAAEVILGGQKKDGGKVTHVPADKLVFAYNTVLGPITSRYPEVAVKDLTFANNIVRPKSGNAVQLSRGTGWKWQGNLLWPALGNAPGGNGQKIDPRLVLKGGLYRLPGKANPAVDKAVALAALKPSIDMDGQKRDARLDVGADEWSTAKVTLTPLTGALVGPTAK